MYKKITHTIVEEHFDVPVTGYIPRPEPSSNTVTTEVGEETTVPETKTDKDIM
jgi:hypothetical protein